MNLENKYIIVSGGTGYIGTHLVNALVLAGANVFVLTRRHITKTNNITYLHYQNSDFENLIKDIDFRTDIIFHLAAKIGRDHCISDLKDYVDTNISLGTFLCELLKENNPEGIFVNTSTYWENRNGEKHDDPVNLYAATKISFYNILKFYSTAYSLKSVTLKLYDVYGENDPRPKLINLILRDKIMNVSSGEQYVDFVNINDVVSAFLKSVEHASELSPKFHITTGRLVKLIDVFKFFNDHSSEQFKLHIAGIGEGGSVLVHKPYCGETLPGWATKHSLYNDLEGYIKNESV